MDEELKALIEELEAAALIHGEAGHPETTRLFAKAAEALRAPTWQGISTAPMDGTVVDLWFNDRRFENMRWNDDLGMWQNHARSVLVLMTPTHWMPLPTPPTDEGET